MVGDSRSEKYSDTKQQPVRFWPNRLVVALRGNQLSFSFVSCDYNNTACSHGTDVMDILVVISEYSSSKQLKVNWNVPYIALDSGKRNSNAIIISEIFCDTFSSVNHRDYNPVRHSL